MRIKQTFSLSFQICGSLIAKHKRETKHRWFASSWKGSPLDCELVVCFKMRLVVQGVYHGQRRITNIVCESLLCEVWWWIDLHSPSFGETKPCVMTMMIQEGQLRDRCGREARHRPRTKRWSTKQLRRANNGDAPWHEIVRDAVDVEISVKSGL